MTMPLLLDAVGAAARLRQEAEIINAARERLENKTARADAGAAAERQHRAELHTLQALPALADRLAAACFDYAERAEGCVMVRDQLADALLSVLRRSRLLTPDARPACATTPVSEVLETW